MVVAGFNPLQYHCTPWHALLIDDIKAKSFDILPNIWVNQLTSKTYLFLSNVSSSTVLGRQKNKETKIV